MNLLTIITVHRDDYSSLSASYNSLKPFLFYAQHKINWLVIDGSEYRSNLGHLCNCNNISIIQECDSGIYNAMNKGILRTESKYLTFLNAGDFLCIKPAEYSCIIDLLSSSSVDMISFSWSQFNFLSNQYVKRSPVLPNNLTSYRMPSVHQSLIYSTSLLTTHLFNESYIICGDYDNYLTLLRLPTFTYLSQADYTWARFDLTGISSKKPNLLFKETIKAFRNHKTDKSFYANALFYFIVFFRIYIRFILLSLSNCLHVNKL
ncbi:hypothetical protein SynMEDNS5_00207 [Synechococcus sp. MEDNS5]|nr:hypothetical protein SynMEDNS5_00207 [Synechococcus sp. MEDNS5]